MSRIAGWVISWVSNSVNNLEAIGARQKYTRATRETTHTEHWPNSG